MVAGFAHAPLTKGVLITLSISTVLVALFQLKPFVHLQVYPHIAVHHQWYRLVTQHFAFVNSSELFLALLLLYNASVKVERMFGTYKFASFLVVTTALYTAVQLLLLGASSLLFTRYLTGAGADSPDKAAVANEERHWLSSGSCAAGPYGPIFAIVYQYHCIVPYLWSFQVGSLELTDQHVTTTSLSVLLAISQPPSTLFSAALSTAISSLYRSGRRLSEWRIPLRVYRICSLLFSPWIGQTRLPQRSWRAEPPVRRTLQAREARLAEHNAAVSNLNRSSSGIGMPRIASLLQQRRRAALLPQTQGQGQGSPGVVQHAVTTPARTRVGWNDVPPPPARTAPRLEPEDARHRPET